MDRYYYGRTIEEKVKGRYEKIKKVRITYEY